MIQIHAGKRRRFTLRPSPPGSRLERPAIVSVTGPAYLSEVAPDGLTGYINNLDGTDVEVLFIADGDGVRDNDEQYNIHYEARIGLIAADAAGFEPDVFEAEENIPA